MAKRFPQRRKPAHRSRNPFAHVPTPQAAGAAFNIHALQRLKHAPSLGQIRLNEIMSQLSPEQLAQLRSGQAVSVGDTLMSEAQPPQRAQSTPEQRQRFLAIHAARDMFTHSVITQLKATLPLREKMDPLQLETTCKHITEVLVGVLPDPLTQHVLYSFEQVEEALCDTMVELNLFDKVAEGQYFSKATEEDVSAELSAEMFAQGTLATLADAYVTYHTNLGAARDEVSDAVAPFKIEAAELDEAAPIVLDSLSEIAG